MQFIIEYEDGREDMYSQNSERGGYRFSAHTRKAKDHLWMKKKFKNNKMTRDELATFGLPGGLMIQEPTMATGITFAHNVVVTANPTAEVPLNIPDPFFFDDIEETEEEREFRVRHTRRRATFNNE